MSLVDSKKVRCACCDKILFDWAGFKSNISQLGGPIAGMATSMKLKDAAGYVHSWNEGRKVVKAGNFIEHGFVEESDKAFCSKDHQKKYRDGEC